LFNNAMLEPRIKGTRERGINLLLERPLGAVDAFSAIPSPELEFVILKLAMLLVFLAWLWGKVS
jgi:hypothetical protein